MISSVFWHDDKKDTHHKFVGRLLRRRKQRMAALGFWHKQPNACVRCLTLRRKTQIRIRKVSGTTAHADDDNANDDAAAADNDEDDGDYENEDSDDENEDEHDDGDNDEKEYADKEDAAAAGGNDD